ncbi:MAG: 23S rRNA (uracil(1939)-C(5))-methyltransferase RlmD [Turicibacter sp.]|nr:23S rRNA (uracil(1939)-C(5))-methyltransferase RlmD [Turicibacter sp.]
MLAKNDFAELQIHDLTAKGSGVGKIDNFVIFTPYALPGDILRVKILKVKKQYAYAKIEKILVPSIHRIDSVCAVFGRCGGCQFQHFDYNAQLIFKEKLVRDALTRIAGVENPPIGSVIGMENPYNYRNKAQFVATIIDGVQAAGFYAQRSHRVIPFDSCNIHISEKTIAAVLEKLPPLKSLRHIVVRVGENTGELMVIFVMSKLERLPIIEQASTVIININAENTNVILGKKLQTIQGSGYYHEQIGTIRYRISPRAFFQINSKQTKRLYDLILAQFTDAGDERVIDAYCGIGGIALYIAASTREVVGVDSVPEAIEDAAHNAQLNNITNAHFICGLAETVIPDLLDECSTIILDPPRKGCDVKLLDGIMGAKIPRIIYISCEPTTLARDLKQLTGYKLETVQPVDMFPLTGHVEIMAVLHRT